MSYVSRYDVRFNGYGITNNSAKILVLDVSHHSPDLSYETYRLAKRHGSRVYQNYYASLSVTITFQIREYDVMKRQGICDSVNKWAKGAGYLYVNDRNSQTQGSQTVRMKRLRCVCTKFASVESVRNWLDPITMEFTAYALPFWENNDTTTKTISESTSGTTSVNVPGSVDGAFFEVTATPASGTLTTLSLTANGRTMSFSGLSIAAGNSLTITYDPLMVQSIGSGATSLLNKRTGVDDLIAFCGNNSLGMTADVSTSVTFSVRGLYI